MYMWIVEHLELIRDTRIPKISVSYVYIQLSNLPNPHKLVTVVNFRSPRVNFNHWN